MQKVVFLCLLVIPAMRSHESHSHDPIRAHAKRVVRNGEFLFEVTASGFVHATPQHVWQVLTDYTGLPDFIPDLLTVKILSRRGNAVRIEQRSISGFLFLSHTVRMVLQIEETPCTTIDVALVDGDMRHYNTHWDITPAVEGSATGTRITFSGAIEPKFPVPPLVGRTIVEANLKRTVEAVVAEIERRNVH
ncbi:MAG TPA: SRPBCC family protein [Noviherbaspirillum sp.]|nr:SRPBCC family protein [Noviherbaspirillum sp.]